MRSAAFAIILLSAYLFATKEESRLTEVWVVNSELEFDYKGKTHVIQLQDEVEEYTVNLSGKEEILRHYRENCYRSPEMPIQKCDNIVIFRDQVYNAIEAD